METQASIIESLFEKAEEYGKTSFEISRLKGLETIIIVLTSMVFRLSVVIMFFMFVIVFNIGIALFLGELLGKVFYGFFIVASFYFSAGLVFYFFLYKWIKKPMSEFIISQVLE